MVSSVTAAQQDGISKYMDQVFDSAYNETLHENDLPNVRWGRIDYLNVTYLTTKWNVWQCVCLHNNSVLAHKLIILGHPTSSSLRIAGIICISTDPINYTCVTMLNSF